MDSEYLKKHVGVALSLGLTEIVQKRPVDPIEYLAFWMRKFVENRDFEDKVSTLLQALGKHIYNHVSPFWIQFTKVQICS